MTPTFILVAVIALPILALVVANLNIGGQLPWLCTVATSAGITGFGIALLVLRSQAVVASGNFRLDSLAGFLFIVIGSVAMLSAAASKAYLIVHYENKPAAQQQLRLYWTLFNLFIVTMLLAAASNNLALTWFAVEATTITTTFLVGFKRTPQSLEAAWKYAIICSLGLSVALLGIVVIYFGASSAGIPGSQALMISVLIRHAKDLNPAILRIGIALSIVGFGAKAGLVPFHTWLPDAHSQAPAPISAMMSGVLLSVAASVVLRITELSSIILGPSYARTILLVIGILTMAVAALLIVGQTELKRLFAQSSMEQMGLVAIAIAINSELAIAALVLHIFVHGIAKSSAFITAGQMEETTGNHHIKDISGMLQTRPKIARRFLLALIALLALPPFGLFISEAGIVTAVLLAGFEIPAILVVLLILIASIGLVRAGISLTLGAPTGALLRRLPHRSALPVTVATVLAAIIGLVGSPTTSVIAHIASSIVSRV